MDKENFIINLKAKFTKISNEMDKEILIDENKIKFDYDTGIVVKKPITPYLDEIRNQSNKVVEQYKSTINEGTIITQTELLSTEPDKNRLCSFFETCEKLCKLRNFIKKDCKPKADELKSLVDKEKANSRQETIERQIYGLEKEFIKEEPIKSEIGGALLGSFVISSLVSAIISIILCVFGLSFLRCFISISLITFFIFNAFIIKGEISLKKKVKERQKIIKLMTEEEKGKIKEDINYLQRKWETDNQYGILTKIIKTYENLLSEIGKVENIFPKYIGGKDIQRYIKKPEYHHRKNGGYFTYHLDLDSHMIKWLKNGRANNFIELISILIAYKNEEDSYHTETINPNDELIKSIKRLNEGQEKNNRLREELNNKIDDINKKI